ncbi:MAG: MBL fold metallo-hydrolase [bacterium]
MKYVDVISTIASVLVLWFIIIGCGAETNTAPIINSFSADRMTTGAGTQVILTVLATDAEDDTLTYKYQPSAGTIVGTGSTVIWIAPEDLGDYTINVVVSDGKLSVQSNLMIKVVALQPKEEKQMELKVQWLGHACFLITSSNGKRVLTDPYGSGIGYDVPSVEADVVLVSHSHFDHNNVSMAKGNPQIVNTVGETSASGISFLGVLSDHDDAGGSKRGKNIIFVWEMEGARLAHLGDLGIVLTDDQIKSVGKVDILFIPVGGTYTIDAKQATKVVELLSPKMVFPMHYKTDVTSLPIAKVDDFLAGKDNVEKINANSVVIKELPEKMKIIVMNYK